MIALINRLFWNTLPAHARSLSNGLGDLLSDGRYLTAWQLIGALILPTALFLGVFCGARHPGWSAPGFFSYSLYMLLPGMVLGFISARAGLAFVLGYGWADLTFWHYTQGYFPIAKNTVIVAAHVYSYAVMAVLCAVTPLNVQRLRAFLPLPSPTLPDARLLIDAVLTALIAAVLLYLTLSAAPLFMRPPFMWTRGGIPSSRAVYWFQHHTITWCLGAFVIAFARTVFEYAAAYRNPSWMRNEGGSDRPSLIERTPRGLRIVLRALVATVFFSGLIATWGHATLAFVGFIAVGVWAVWISQYRALHPIIERIPVLLRIAATAVVAVALLHHHLPSMRQTDAFGYLLVILLIALTIAKVLFPSPVRAKS